MAKTSAREETPAEELARIQRIIENQRGQGITPTARQLRRMRSLVLLVQGGEQ